MKDVPLFTTMNRFWVWVVLIHMLFTVPPVLAAQETPPQAVVRAVLFYSPTCGHCHYVITEILPLFFEQYGDQLQVIGIDVSQPDGWTLFINALQMFGLDRGAVPFLVVGDTYLVGDVDIPQQFPELIEYHLALGGTDWPDIPGLVEMLIAVQSTQEAQPTPTPIPLAPSSTIPATFEDTPVQGPVPVSAPESLILTGEVESSLGDRLAQDPAGNGLAIVVLIGMLISVGWGGRYFQQTAGRRMMGAILWIFPALCIAGLGVASYLSYVEITQVEAVCGPVGDCNTVQQSEYARLFGILPVGLLGMAGYVMILLAWAIMMFKEGRLSDRAATALLGMTFFGTLFSVYLTFLEPFIIGATCAWCLSSAIIMTVLMLLSIAPGKLDVRRLLRRK